MTHVINLQNNKQKHVCLDNWKRQIVDTRDSLYQLKMRRSIVFGAAQSKCDNRNLCSPIEDQADLGSCTANAFAGLIEFNENKAAMNKLLMVPTFSVANPAITISNISTLADGTISYLTTVKPASTPAPTPTPTPIKSFIDVSRLFTYYATRKIEGSTSKDSGASIRDTVKSGYQYGVISEALYPYTISKFATNPSTQVWAEAAKHKIASYHAINDGDLETMKTVLLSGFLIQFGFDVYTYFVSDDMTAKGILPLPDLKKESLLGGHSCLIVGFDDNFSMPDGTKGAFIMRNSWSANWGIKGYFYMGYNYVDNISLCSDFWVVQSNPF